MTKRQLMKDFQRPTSTVFDYDETNRNFARFVAHPYERGLGVTIGNSLRRILLSSIEGYAISAMRVSYVDEELHSKILMSEFQSIEHVSEDTVEIIANLKHCHLSVEGDVDKEFFSFEVNTEGVVTAEIFKTHPNVTIYNPEQVILTAMKGVNLNFEIQIEKGVGYRTAEEGKKLLDVADAISVDALFSPVLHVMMKVEKVRVGHRTDYDKLILEVETNGAVRPQDALAEAAKIAKEHYTLFINFNEDEVEVVDYQENHDDLLMRTMDISIDTLELSARASNCLSTHDIKTLGELISRSEQEIVEMRNFGKKSLEEIRNKLKNEWNLDFDMTDPNEIMEALNSNKRKNEASNIT